MFRLFLIDSSALAFRMFYAYARNPLRNSKGQLVSLLFFYLSLCSCTSPDDGFHFDEEKFMSEWNIWKSQDIKNYGFILKGKLPYWNYTKAIYMEGYEVEIVVRDGVMNTFEYIGRTPHQEMDSESILEPEYTSMSDMYQKIYDSIKDCELFWKETANKGCFVSKRYEIKYDPKYHYITYFEPITEVESGCMLDTDEHEVTVSVFFTYSIKRVI